MKKVDPIELAFIQPTPFCNIDCKYCFLPDRSSPRRMSEETLRQTFGFLFRQPELVHPRVKVLWHAGEPLTAGIAFYENAFRVQKELAPPGIVPENSFQTNGMLLSPEWCDLIEKWNVKIGISLDGPERIHDANRVDRAGKGTFSHVLKGIKMLQGRGIGFHVIAVLSEHSLPYPDELWNFYRSLGIRKLHLLIEELQGVHTSRELRLENLQTRLEKFFARLLDLRDADPEPVYIRELDNVFHKVRLWPIQVREIEQFPVGILNVSWDGKLSTLSPDLLGAELPGHGTFVLGNVATSSIQDLLDAPIYRTVHAEISAGFNRCRRECSYFGLCGGGQPSIKLYENRRFDSTDTPSCTMRIKAATNVVLTAMEERLGIEDARGSAIADRISRIKMRESDQDVVLGQPAVAAI